MAKEANDIAVELREWVTNTKEEVAAAERALAELIPEHEPSPRAARKKEEREELGVQNYTEEEARDIAAKSTLQESRLQQTCSAVLYHGPGHQSKSRCTEVGPHDVHRTIYGDRLAEWEGMEGMTGYFDEPPQINE
jgi:hypothetical protein